VHQLVNKKNFDNIKRHGTTLNINYQFNNNDKRASIKLYAFKTNPLTFQQLSNLLDHPQGVLPQTSIYIYIYIYTESSRNT